MTRFSSKAEGPRVTRVYRNHHLDSTRWEPFEPRDDDVIISTAYKAGTTWTQMICGLLIFQDASRVGALIELSPWIDMAGKPLDEVLNGLKAQQHRRFIKSHLALDGLPFYENVKYIVVGRHPLDVFMSLWNHYGNYSDGFYELLDSIEYMKGIAMPRCPKDIRELWQGWISRSWFDWEPEGYPFWSFFHHIRTWWEFRHLPSIYFVHYNDLKADLAGEMRKIAAYLEIVIDEEVFPSLVEAATFDSMKENAEKIVAGAEDFFKDGPKAFIYKGTNERWRGVLTDDDLAQYEALKRKELDPALAHWLEVGTRIAGDPRTL
ncbi:MAG: sulfotransferase domain-containing protein [Candidatus Tectomicrobia bacterium]|uniref:Sulfotransferase domain-containing protein n=1 Tax=Tectimicrobiota bacterium TaxID=2528274 RepID=A0A932FZF4_UNCTE|nr:sulfotransferase domain-containing protein [Candidatus Tectomicrobia bacterium]